MLNYSFAAPKIPCNFIKSASICRSRTQFHNFEKQNVLTICVTLNWLSKAKYKDDKQHYKTENALKFKATNIYQVCPLRMHLR